MNVRYHKYSLILFFLLSLIPLTWLHGYPVGFGDAGIKFFFYNTPYFLKLSSYVWLSSNIGMPGYYFLSFPFAFFFQILLFIVHSYFIAQEVLFVCVFFLSLISFYLFSQNIINSNKYNRIIPVLSAIFYVFSSFTITYFLLIGDLFIFFSLPFIPLFLLIFIKGIKTLKFIYILAVSVLMACFSILPGTLTISLPPIILIAFFLFIREIYQNFNNKIYIKRVIKYLIIMFMFIVLINAWWIFSFFSQAFVIYSNNQKLVSFNLVLSSLKSVTNIYLFLRSFPYKQSYLKIAHSPHYLYFYYSPYFIFIGTLVSFIILLPIIKESKKFILYILMFILGIFLAIGYSSPFGGFKLWLFNLIPLKRMLLIGSFFFVPFIIVPSAILFGLGILIIYEFLNKKINRIAAKLIIFLFVLIINVVYVFPLWSGIIFNGRLTGYESGNSRFREKVYIPFYYKNISIYFRQDNLVYNILSLPINPNPTTYRLFKWKYKFYSAAPLYLLYEHSEISSIYNNFYPQNIILNSFQNNKLKQISKMCSLFSIKYLVIQKDFYNPKYKNNKISFSRFSYYFKVISTDKLLSILNNNKKNIKFISNFGRLSLYKIKDKYFIAPIYTPTNLIFVSSRNGSFNDFANKNDINYDLVSLVPNITMMPHYTIRSAIFFTMLNIKKKSFELNNIRRHYKLKKRTMFINGKIRKIELNIKQLSTPTIEFKKINPTKYIVIVHNAKANFPLIFNQHYAHFWNIYVEKYNVHSRKQSSLLKYNCNQNYDDCMSSQKLLYNIKKNNISTIGNQFISKDFNGTIQNNNLPDGHILQTLFQKPYPQKYHFIVNGYANSWWINLKDIKKLGTGYYKVNKNGTYDFEFIIDYWPQRLFYIGIIISGTTVILFGLYLIYDAVKKRKTR